MEKLGTLIHRLPTPDPTATCRVCQRPLPDTATSLTCPDCLQLQASAARRRTYEEHVDDAYRGIKWPDIEGQAAAVSAAQRWVTSAERGVYIFGASGTGKSMIAACIGYASVSSGHSARWLNCVELIMDAEDRRARYNGPTRLEYLQTYIAPDLLILDDLGYGSSSDAARMTVYVLLNRRWQARRRTVVTSNYSLKALAENLGAQIADRITRAGPLIEVAGTTHNTPRRM